MKHQITQVTVALLMGAALNSGQGRAEELEDNTSPFKVALPYVGYGEMSILEDGLLVLQLGGKPASDENGRIEPVIDEVTLAVTTADTELVRTEALWLLDKAGRQLADVGISTSGVISRQPLRDLPEGECGPRQLLLDVAGELRIEMDFETLIGSISIQGHRFDGSQEVAFVVEFELVPPSDVVAQACTCSTSCSKGNCTITCSSRARCVCYCDSNGYPKCRCEEMNNIELIP